MGAYLRYCPDCREEYQPHMTHCLDCGGPLKEKLDGEEVDYGALPDSAPEPEPGSSLPPGEYRSVASGLSAQVLEPVVKLLVEGRIPVKVESLSYGLTLSVRDEDRSAVIAILEREGAIPAQPDAASPAVAAEGGPCPACGSHLAPGTVECPECGLLLGSAGCDRCGAELSPTDEKCPACGHALD